MMVSYRSPDAPLCETPTPLRDQYQARMNPDAAARMPGRNANTAPPTSAAATPPTIMYNAVVDTPFEMSDGAIAIVVSSGFSNISTTSTIVSSGG